MDGAGALRRPAAVVRSQVLKRADTKRYEQTTRQTTFPNTFDIRHVMHEHTFAVNLLQILLNARTGALWKLCSDAPVRCPLGTCLAKVETCSQ